MFSDKLIRIDGRIDNLFTWENTVDNTFEMSMIALLYSRISNPVTEFNVYSYAEYVKELEQHKQNPDVYTVNLYRNTLSNPDQYFENLKSRYTVKSYAPQEKYITKKLSEIHISNPLFIRSIPEINTVCIFTTTMTAPMWHAIQTLIPKFFPIFAEKPITRQETDYLLAFTSKDSFHYRSKLKPLINTKEFDRLILAKSLPGIEKKLYQYRIDNIQKDLKNLDDLLEKALDTYRMYYSRRMDVVATLTGLETMRNAKEDHTELEDYILNNKNICNFTINNNMISFIVKTQLVPYNQSDWDIVSSNRDFFTDRSKKYSTDEVRLLLNALFSRNRKLKLKMCAIINMDYFGSEVHSVRAYDYDAVGLSDYIPNPHLNIHDCFGQNSVAILEQLKYGDLIGAIECAIQTVQKVNFLETYTFQPFAKILFESEGKCILAGDQEMTVSEAIEYLKGLKNE